VDDQGSPEGALQLTVTNWRGMLDVAQGSGVLDAGLRPQAETILGMLSNLGGDPDTLNMTLTFMDGTMALGPIHLGPAPRLILH
jgi:hypothetical protein